jgi:hypothetical protein
LACDSGPGLLAGEVSQEIYGRALVGNFELLSPMIWEGSAPKSLKPRRHATAGMDENKNDLTVALLSTVPATMAAVIALAEIIRSFPLLPM